MNLKDLKKKIKLKKNIYSFDIYKFRDHWNIGLYFYCFIQPPKYIQ